MLKRDRILSTLAAALLTACQFLGPASCPAWAASVSTVVVRIFPDGPAVEGGSSTLVRSDSGVTATMKTSGLEPGAAYTLWWVVFSHPENCSPPRCSLDDVVPFPGNEAAGTSLIYASGHIVGSSAESDFAGLLKVGDPTAVMFGPGLVDPHADAVHLVLRNHGQPIEGEVDSQIGSFGGGCSQNTCSNEQMAIHDPLTDSTSASLAAIRQSLDRISRWLGLRPN